MADTFKSVKLSIIAKAFACAHHYAGTAGSLEDRKRFHHVARLIWDACGEGQPMPLRLPDNLTDLVDAGETLGIDLWAKRGTANETDGSSESTPEAKAK